MFVLSKRINDKFHNIITFQLIVYQIINRNINFSKVNNNSSMAYSFKGGHGTKYNNHKIFILTNKQGILSSGVDRLNLNVSR